MGDIGETLREVRFEPITSASAEVDLPWERAFAARLKQLREERGLSQTELAKRAAARGLPFHQQTIQRVETGARPIRLNEALVLSELVGWDLAAMTAAVTPDGAQALLRHRQEVADEVHRRARDTLRIVAQQVERAEADLREATEAYMRVRPDASVLDLEADAMVQLAAGCRALLGDLEEAAEPLDAGRG